MSMLLAFCPDDPFAQETLVRLPVEEGLVECRAVGTVDEDCLDRRWVSDDYGRAVLALSSSTNAGKGREELTKKALRYLKTVPYVGTHLFHISPAEWL